jgi:rhamnose transport system substrate-binding protein
MRQIITRRHFLAVSSFAMAGLAQAQESAVAPVRIALVAPEPGDDYYNACRQGVLEAAAEVAGAQVTYTSPATADGNLQAEVINRLVVEGYDAIVLAPIVSDVVIAATQKAEQAGVRILSIDNALPPESRTLHLAPPDIVSAAPQLLGLLNAALNKQGEVALLGLAPQDGTEVDFMKALQREWLKPDFRDLALITTVYGGGKLQQSYAETLAILQAYPTLTGILAPSLGGILGASRAVADLGRGQNVKVTGIGLPSRLIGAVQAGIVPAFLTWSPVDVGYAAARIALSLVKNEIVVQAGLPILTGRLGQLPVDDNGVARVAELVSVDATSIDKYAELF